MHSIALAHLSSRNLPDSCTKSAGQNGKFSADPAVGTLERLSLSAQEQFASYADAVFPSLIPAGKYVELRGIETWTAGEKKQSHVAANLWLRPSEFKAYFHGLSQLNETANIFVGVNLRSERLGTKDSIQEAYCISADLDYCSPYAAYSACRQIGLPDPSILVGSGHGAHVYYLFDSPYHFRTHKELTLFEEAARGFQQAIGADSTSDVTRLLRVPGFLNTKDLQNGATPVPCVLVHCSPDLRYPPTLFLDRWRPDEKPTLSVSLAAHRLPDARTEKRIAGVLRYLANDKVTDRSRRDFGVLAGLLRLGLSPDEIWPLVQNFSKFATSGERYFRTTVTNAQRALEGQSFF